jgi:hypothetical protein
MKWDSDKEMQDNFSASAGYPAKRTRLGFVDG